MNFILMVVSQGGQRPHSPAYSLSACGRRPVGCQTNLYASSLKYSELTFPMVGWARLASKYQQKKEDFPKKSKRTDGNKMWEAWTPLSWPHCLGPLGAWLVPWPWSEGPRRSSLCVETGHLDYARTCHFLKSPLFAVERGPAVHYESFHEHAL